MLRVAPLLAAVSACSLNPFPVKEYFDELVVVRILFSDCLFLVCFSLFNNYFFLDTRTREKRKKEKRKGERKAWKGSRKEG